MLFRFQSLTTLIDCNKIRNKYATVPFGCRLLLSSQKNSYYRLDKVRRASVRKIDEKACFLFSSVISSEKGSFL
jgi:hypothetical protein